MNGDDSVRVLATVGLVTIVTFGTAMPAQAAVESAERAIESTDVEPGDPVEVVVEIHISGTGDRMSISESYESQFREVEIRNVTYNAEREVPTISLADKQSGVLLGIGPGGGFDSGDTVTVAYGVRSRKM
jgi:hypothetical protein